MPKKEASQISKLVLGSVQFGMHYGISNQHGSPEDIELEKLLRAAKEAGIACIDTAAAYGKAEERLGKYASDFELITKLKSGTTAQNLQSNFEESLRRLKRSSVKALMFHDFNDWRANPELWLELKKLRAKHKTTQIGFSLYDPEELSLLIEADVIPDIVQVPFNLFDRRFEACASIFEKHQIEVHTRSVFLQGLLFFKAADLPKHFQSIQEKQKGFYDWLASKGRSVLEVSLAHALNQSWIDRVLIGVSTSHELEENLASLNTIDSADLKELSFMSESNPEIINPSKWK